MAIWQFTLHCLPKLELEKRYRLVPITISQEDFDNHPWWQNLDILKELAADLDNWSMRTSSWSPDLWRWGDESEDDISVLVERARLLDFETRVNVREINVRFIGEIVRIAQKFGFVFIAGKQHVLEPSVSKILKAIYKSPSFRFVIDPAKFLAELDSALGRDVGEQ